MRKLALACLMMLGLAACGAEQTWAPDADVTRFAYAHPGSPTLTLITAINNRTGAGGHSALLVSGSQRVLFDPAGSWHHPTAPERNDVLFGMNDTLVEFFIDYHARETYHVVTQEVTVSSATAEQALALVKARGAVPKASCGIAVSGILRELGFDAVSAGWFPNKIMDDFATVPGVRESKIFDDSPDNNFEALRQQRVNARAAEILAQ